MEVKIEESERWKFQTQTNQTRIPFPHGASRPDGETFIQDCISKKVVKNTGQLPMYLIQNNHPAIVSREVYQAVQAEKARRSATARK